MTKKGYTHGPETRAKMAASRRGKKLSPETRAKIAAAHLGKKHSPESIAKMRAARLGKTPSPETRAKLSAAMRGRQFSAEHRAKIGAANRRRVVGRETRAKMSASGKTKVFSAEHRANICIGLNRPETRARRSALMCGEKGPAWRGGISREPYAWAFDDELKEEVRRRDGYKCQLCGCPQAECKRLLHVHHIEYDKKNSDPVNLVSLCPSCHGRTNTNREYWTKLLQAKMLKIALAEL